MKTRPAFTLIETVLALGLSSGLLLVMFSLVNSTAYYHITSQDQIMSSQRLLGLFQDLRYDLHLVQTDPAWIARRQLIDPIDDALAENQLLDRSKTELRVRSLEAFAKPIQLVGTSEAILLTIARNNPRFDRPQSTNATEDQNKQQPYEQLLWTHSRSLPLAMPSLVAGSTILSRRFERQSSQGLLRLAFQSSGANRGAVSDGLAHIVASDIFEDVSQVRFRYYDGTEWLSSWSSVDKKNLPISIEVSFEGGKSQQLHRWVVCLIQSAKRLPASATQGDRP